MTEQVIHKSALKTRKSGKSVLPGITILVAVWIFSACSTQKNTWISRSYHSLTAKYNVYFNGEQSFEGGTKKIDENIRDDFSKLLPVFKYGDKAVVQLIGPEMERTVKKCSKLITMHSITVKPKVKGSKNLTPKEREFFNKKEYNPYVPEAYLLMGKAHFYKHEYDLASQIFHLILTDYKNQIVTYEAQLWLAKLEDETRDYKSAEEILNGLENNAGFPKKYLNELYPAIADYYLKQNDYPNGIKYLEKSLLYEKKKGLRERYCYILAQLYEKTGDLKKASDYYSLVIKMNPPYEMAFNAHINRALAYQQGFGSAHTIEDELMKMLKDDKNIEYKDQIYYALGDLAAKEGNTDKAIEQYTNSIKYSVNNDRQKARSYLTLADLYYSRPDYVNSQIYYDSTLSVISTDYPGYADLYSKSKSLTRLVADINTVALEDSVQVLARMDKTDMYAKIDQIIDNLHKQQEAERQKQQEAELDKQFSNDISSQTAVNNQSGSQTGKWYFYNETSKSLGLKEFKLKWGNRKLEDHWQRINKAPVVFTNNNPDEGNQVNAEGSKSDKVPDKMSRDYYLKNIPLTDSAMTASNSRIENSLYDMGLVYRNDLKDYEKANESFKNLIKRFPRSGYLLSAYFNLYTMSKEENNPALTDYYKNMIIGQFPESQYAKFLKNPDYVKEIEEEEKKVENYYDQTYDYFNAGNYPEVISRVDYALANYPGNKYIPQFEYLRVLSGGKTSDRKVFRDNLVTFISKYPNTDIASDAQNVVDYIDKVKPEYKEAEEKTIAEKLYQVSDETEHTFAFITDKGMNNNQLIFNVINFNLDNFDSLNLRVEIVSLNPRQNLIVVKSFKNKTEVMNYMNAIEKDKKIYKDLNVSNLPVMAISTVNLKILMEDKITDRYMKFFNEHYH